MGNVWELNGNMDLWFLALPLGSVSTCAWKKNRVVGLRISTTGLKQCLLSDFKTTVFTCHLLLMMSWFWQGEHTKKKSPSESQFSSEKHDLNNRHAVYQTALRLGHWWPAVPFWVACKRLQSWAFLTEIAGGWGDNGCRAASSNVPPPWASSRSPRGPRARGRLLPSSDTFCFAACGLLSHL